MVAYNIVFAGETGVGKSSSSNRLFDLEVSPTSNDFLGASGGKGTMYCRSGLRRGFSSFLSSPNVLPPKFTRKQANSNIFIDWHNVNLHSESPHLNPAFSKEHPFQYLHPLVKPMSQDNDTFTGNS
ncbi:hypothetical protein PISMIDRAFT_398420 [Pisolithus microcarpus 441]|uniref:Uncharacterized protein n=1 Tax=Pisolithus microcarpus 441 TaxID=765257 RepID=A0A0C9Z671_9AGAM|nr:hypothetical protein BKA83DRAFT_398420 [Pisolithus microcarpus]KIK24696.1 hypothetical protein PISMIDRAFT_398420 [Pisolithus microcarpus 441]